MVIVQWAVATCLWSGSLYLPEWRFNVWIEAIGYDITHQASTIMTPYIAIAGSQSYMRHC